MPIRFRYDTERDVLLQVAEGSIALSDVDDLRAARHEAGVPSTIGHCLIDFRGIELEVAPRDLRALGEDGPPIQPPARRTAVLADEARVTAMTLMWKGMQSPDHAVEVFSTLGAAYRWLGVEPRDDDLAF
ncbi:MAG TPA: hypothetical protein VKA86_19375 [Candidatus Krumholzibacteria bacterium]|nr:hypothetical protein [Candidatus Krumholzibacteria bacterium]